MTSPTRVRYLVVALTTLSAVLLYLDRFCISFAGGFIKEDLGLTNNQIGWMLSAFFWTYALAQVPSGFLSDRWGARLMLTLYILFWSLFTGLTGLALSFAALMMLRLGFGVAQAGAYPTAASLLSKWVTYQTRGTASSLVAFGGRVGGIIAPPVTALLIVAFVSPSRTSLLEPSDILDYPQLCYELTEGPRAITQDSILMASWPLADLSEIRETGSKYAAAKALQREKKIPLNKALDQLGVSSSTDEQWRALTAWLNEALQYRYLSNASQFQNLDLPRDAKTLSRRDREDLTQSEVERLNRLVLEAAYPEGIKKLYVDGWRPMMLTYGLAGLMVALLFWFQFRDRPEQHPSCNIEEVRLIEESRPPGMMSPHGKARRVPLLALCTSLSMWLMCLAQLGTNVGWVFLVTWLPRYLDEVYRVSIEKRGVLASVPLVVGAVGMLCGGWLTDRLTRTIGLRWGRALPLAVSRFLAMGAFLLLLIDLGDSTANLYLAMFAFSLVAFATDLGTSSVWAFMQDVGGRHVGSVLGWGNMWGNFGAGLSPPLLNWIVEKAGWPSAFMTCAGVFLLSGVCALGVNATAAMLPPEEAKPE